MANIMFKVTLFDFHDLNIFHHHLCCHDSLQGAPPMVFHDISLPLVYGMAFLAMAFDKVTS